MLWNPEAETLPRERLEALQLTRFARRWIASCSSVPVMRERLRAAGVTSAADLETWMT